MALRMDASSPVLALGLMPAGTPTAPRSIDPSLIGYAPHSVAHSGGVSGSSALPRLSTGLLEGAATDASSVVLLTPPATGPHSCAAAAVDGRLTPAMLSHRSSRYRLHHAGSAGGALQGGPLTPPTPPQAPAMPPKGGNSSGGAGSVGGGGGSAAISWSQRHMTPLLAKQCSLDHLAGARSSAGGGADCSAQLPYGAPPLHSSPSYRLSSADAGELVSRSSRTRLAHGATAAIAAAAASVAAAVGADGSLLHPSPGPCASPSGRLLRAQSSSRRRSQSLGLPPQLLAISDYISATAAAHIAHTAAAAEALARAGVGRAGPCRAAGYA
ncbi:hypothetical protein GPECTOR_622g715 [Gonium pectorale]|uniref:Uncharacterized protein n=1 Tax=Gonium pectorale TaxID=33097 RepID=A0A150FUF3_GONPE|nr:hypothetical protein GPECTOR_622g715 [Gonium pectorale]|eukprot:KXZ41237.1 hypothetical protein GPECTOR_622g715 [Gonium pectorale]